MFEKRYDVLVAGGGVAGAAAALEAARRGARVCLVEKTVQLGGLATSGLIHIYLPIDDGFGRQVIFGLSEELLKLSFKYGPGDMPPNWRAPGPKPNKERCRVVFSPASFVLALDEALLEAGVDLWLDTLVSSAVMEGDALRGAEVENKSGRGRLLAGCTVDATGDADVAARAGAPCAASGNWLSMWAFQCSLENARQAVEQNDGPALMDRLVVRGGGGGGSALAPPDGGYSGVDGLEVSRYILDSRKMLFDHYKALYAEGADRREVYPLMLPSMAQFRTTRCIDGRAMLHAGQDGQRFEDSVGLAPDWRKAGPVWEIPYGTLVPQKVKGLVAAGRCTAADGDAWHITRVIPVAALTGQIAGVSAALAADRGCSPCEIEATEMQKEMRALGQPVHLDEV